LNSTVGGGIGHVKREEGRVVVVAWY